jgi:3-phosphoshikimate 1-carboxyvinyltransferase
VVRQAEELRHKESDRIAALAAELRSIGVSVEESGDGFAVRGTGSVAGGKGASHGDHRLAMALTVAGLASKQGVQVEGADCISESFPEFTGILNALGAGL